MARLKRKPKPSRPNVHDKVRPLSKAARTEVLERDNMTCTKCGADCAERHARTAEAWAELRGRRDWVCRPPNVRTQWVATAAGVSLEEAQAVMAGKVCAQVDHIVPRAERGTNDTDNLQTLCIPCHQRKSAADTSRFARLPTTRTTR